MGQIFVGANKGAQLLAAIGTLGKVVEIDELEARITELEKQHAKT